MKKIILLMVLMFGPVINAQRFDWVTTAGYEGITNSYNGAVAVARDSQGNLYTLDAANGTQQCQGISANPFGTNTNLFLYKFNVAGEIVYIKPIGTNFKPLNLVVGEDDNVYVLGALMGTSTIQVNNEVITDTENRNYVFKFDPIGNLIWTAKNNISFGSFKEASMLLFANNHLYFQSGPLSITKLNTSGQYVTTLTADSFSSTTSANGVFFRGAGVLSNGDLVFSATSRGTITYGTNVFAPTYNSFLHVAMLTIRTTESLSFVWGNYVNGLRDPDLNSIPMAVGNDDGIYLGLQISGTVTAGSDTIISENTSGTTIGGILKLDANGNNIWVKSTTANVQTWSILNNPNGSGVFCGGQIFGFQPIILGETTINPSNGNSYITKIDYNGDFQNSFAFSEGPIGSYVRSLASDNLGVFYVGGRLNNNTSPIFSCISREGNTGLYLAKFTEQPDTVPQPFLSNDGNALVASPVFSGNIQWFLDDQPITGATEQMYNPTVSGNYKVSFSHVPACTKTSAVLDFNLFNSECWQSISAGEHFTLAIAKNGSLWGWGQNSHGELGDGSTSHKYIPTQISTDTNWKSISAGTLHTMALKSDGTLWGCGSNTSLQLGNGDNTNVLTLTQLGTANNWKTICAGYYHTMAIKEDGSLWGWGSNGDGFVGNGTTLSQNLPVQIGSSSSSWKSVTTGTQHTVAIKTDGTLWAWGHNLYGQMGNGTSGLAFPLVPTQVGTDSNWQSASAQGYRTLAMKTDGTIWAWGINSHGQLGIGTSTDVYVPTQIGINNDWKSIHAGVLTSFAIKNDGTLWAWGNNDGNDGLFGNGTTVSSTIPVQIGTEEDWLTIAVGRHAVALKNNGNLNSWGYNPYGGIGNDTTETSYVPISVDCPLPTFTFTPQTIAGGLSYSVFVCSENNVTATGNNSWGQLGNGTTTNTLTATAVNGLTDVISVSTRDQFTLYLKSDGTVWASGYNGHGQFGNGTTISSSIPMPIPSLSGIVKISTGTFHSLFLKNDGTVWACGRNFSGEVGNGNALQQNTPQQVINVSDVIDIAAGEYHSMFLQSDGTVKSCGDNQDGALGLGDVGWSAKIIPTLVGIQNIKAVGAGFRQSIFIKQDGTVWASGINNSGQLGSGGNESQWSPVLLPNLTGISAATAGYYHALYLKNDGTVWASGYNAYGQLGDGTTIDRDTAVQVSNLTGINGIAVSGNHHSLFSKNDGTFYACGLNNGAYGNGSITSSSIPVLAQDNCVLLQTEENTISKITVYPNPTNGILNITSNKLGTATVTIYDLNGRIVHQSKAENIENKSLDLNHLQSGIYILDITAENYSYTQKLIKQ